MGYPFPSQPGSNFVSDVRYQQNQPEYLRPQPDQTPTLVVQQPQPLQVYPSQPQILVSPDAQGPYAESSPQPLILQQQDHQAQEQDRFSPQPQQWEQQQDEYQQAGDGSLYSIPTTPFEYYNLAQTWDDPFRIRAASRAASRIIPPRGRQNSEPADEQRPLSILESAPALEDPTVTITTEAKEEENEGAGAMNSDESDFDWDEDINIDDGPSVAKDKRKKKKERSIWKQLAPFLRMVILIVTVTPVLALPAILTSVFLRTHDDNDVNGHHDHENERYKVSKDAVVVVFTWLAFMWIMICLNNWLIDLLPAAAVMACSCVAPTKVETLKSLVYPLVRLQMWQVLVIRILVSLCILCGLILVEKVILHKVSKNFHQIAYADRIQDNKYALAVLGRLGTSWRNVKRTRGGGGGGGYSANQTGGRSSPVPVLPAFENQTETAAAAAATTVAGTTATPSLAESRSYHISSRTNSWDNIYPESKGHILNNHNISAADLLDDQSINSEAEPATSTVSEITQQRQRTQS
ncbi:hypothetical protein BGX29_000584 [Mortierella sp. GBA35]|nr:hypothetical protein BGX29_000584 [Mortierella sp. GBA35]